MSYKRCGRWSLRERKGRKDGAAGSRKESRFLDDAWQRFLLHRLYHAGAAAESARVRRRAVEQSLRLRFMKASLRLRFMKDEEENRHGESSEGVEKG